MVSKTFLLISLASATLLIITSQVVAFEDSTFNHGRSEAVDANMYRRDEDHGYYDDGPGGDYDGRCGRDHRDDGHGQYYKGGCRYGCCDDGQYDNDGCKYCCKTRAEATAYKVAQQARTRN